MRTRITPLDFGTAAQMVDAWHRHLRAPQGHKFSIGLASGDELVGAIIVGRPVARHLDDGLTLEVTRAVVVDDIPNDSSAKGSR